ncbi:MAG: M23 family metallopeptidase [Paraglaciecola sp.]|uniref:M23 family metallopeptidase n=1 Tax=Paraglaciecola sp. TaxID=1920173 RepID=UPI00273EBEC0|nr:M23 family metallopeptidase [Paraglaciecola sp.]MDP5029719.1 M23 family metallopeptidase [Paraglaciecola sp.]MDP5040097.1 M23 family metallopeptidase [Paraglaciecola sp.]MDP5131663.1 M23 family metallopeptidase [Paraglaciecola sp.]
MNITLLVKSEKTRLKISIDKQKILIALLLISGVFLISSRSTQSIDEKVDRINYAKAGFEQQQKEVTELKNTAEQQLISMTMKLAEMQSHLLRLNALGARLVEEANLSPQEFSFAEGPAMGGPMESTELAIPIEDSLINKMDGLLAQIQHKTQQLNALESIMLSHHIKDASRLAGRPVTSGWLSSHYGVRKDPFNGQAAMHKGVDFAGKEGDAVLATAAGVVTWADERYGYGNLVEIDHGEGLVTRYGHNKLLNVKIGDVVTKGQIIAEMGNTGRSTGAHVHYEVLRKGQHLDPLPYVYRD